MSSPSLGQIMPNGRFPPPGIDGFASHPMGFGPPPGLSFQEDLASPMGNASYNGASGPSTNMEVSQSGSAHGESRFFRSTGWESLVSVPSCRAFSAETISSALI